MHEIASRQASALFYAKVWYGLFFGSLAFVFPFVNLYYLRLGYSADQIGFIAALRPLVGASTGNAWSVVADRYKCHKLVFLVLHVASVLLTASMALKAAPYAYLVALVLVTQVLSAPVAILADTVVIAATTDVHQYGQARVWGALLWGAVNAFSGSIILSIKMTGAFAVYAGCALTGTCVIWRGLDFGYLYESESGDACQVSSDEQTSGIGPVQVIEMHEKVLIGGDIDRDIEGTSSDCVSSHEEDMLIGGAERMEAGEGESPCTHDGHLEWGQKMMVLVEPEVLLFLIKAVLMGMGMGVVEGFMFLYLSELGASERLMGLSLTFTCLAEVPVFQFAGRILQSLGIQGSFHLVLAAFVVRLAAYSTMAWWPSINLVLPIELLHGLTFGLAWAAGTEHAKSIAPRGLEATLQSAFQSSYFGVGTGLGGLVGGLLYQHAGPVMCFRITAMVIACGWFTCSLLESVVPGFGARDRSSPTR